MKRQKPKFKIGDKLKTTEYTKEYYNIDYVTIISINYNYQVYYWVADWVIGKITSGYFFTEAELYNEAN